jgi:hypothetical protein
MPLSIYAQQALTIHPVTLLALVVDMVMFIPQPHAALTKACCSADAALVGWCYDLSHFHWVILCQLVPVVASYLTDVSTRLIGTAALLYTISS